MKFYVKNDFTFGGVKKIKGEIIEVNPNKIVELQKANVLGAPIKETIIETAILKPVENEMLVVIHPAETVINHAENLAIKQNIKKVVKKPVKKGKK